MYELDDGDSRKLFFSVETVRKQSDATMHLGRIGMAPCQNF